MKRSKGIIDLFILSVGALVGGVVAAGVLLVTAVPTVAVIDLAKQAERRQIEKRTYDRTCAAIEKGAAIGSCR